MISFIPQLASQEVWIGEQLAAELVCVKREGKLQYRIYLRNGYLLQEISAQNLQAILNKINHLNSMIEDEDE